MADFSQNIKFSRNFFKGRIEINFSLKIWGNDWIITFYGGKRELGTVQLWSHDEKLQNILQYNPPEHEEYLIIKALLEKINEAPFNKALFYGGIHYENLLEEETGFIIKSAHEFGEWILSS
ncbi:MAG: hypothetical protein KAR38_14895 [Calditrichia bacterium]|nr:hypothetical protein [Calditrichia bacterium]